MSHRQLSPPGHSRQAGQGAFVRSTVAGSPQLACFLSHIALAVFAKGRCTAAQILAGTRLWVAGAARAIALPARGRCCEHVPTMGLWVFRAFGCCCDRRAAGWDRGGGKGQGDCCACDGGRSRRGVRSVGTGAWVCAHRGVTTPALLCPLQSSTQPGHTLLPSRPPWLCFVACPPRVGERRGRSLARPSCLRV